MPGVLGNLGAGRPPKANPMFPSRRVASETQLPLAYTGPIPEWPLDDASPAELRRWCWLWRKPQAVMWVKDGIEDVIARYVRNCIILESPAGKLTMATANLVSECRQQEDRMGRSPLALQRMRWQVSEDELAEIQRDRGEQAPVRRLRAIDPSVAEG